MTRQSIASAQEAFRLGNCVVRPDLDQIQGPDGAVDIEPKSMAVLLCLVAHAGEVVSADYLIDVVWQGRPMGDNPVYNCVTKLRKALGDTARKRKVIATIPKKGYRLICTVGLHAPDIAPQQNQLPPRQPPPSGFAVASIAVLPFTNLSQDAEHGFFAQGIAAELHNSLSRVHRLRVASRRSSFCEDIDGLETTEVARRLNVQYLLSGTVRCVNNKVRVIVELDDGRDGTQLWSRALNGSIDDILAMEQDIATSIVQEFGGERLRAEIARNAQRPAGSLDAWSLVQKARAYILDYSSAALERALPLLERAVAIEPDNVAARAALGSMLAERILNGISTDRDRDEGIAREAIAVAMSHAPVDPFVLKMCGSAWAWFGECDKSLRALRRAVTIAPFDFGAWGHLGWPLSQTGVADDLTELHAIMERIMRDAPHHPGVPYWRHHKSVAYTCADSHAEAVAQSAEAVELNANFSFGWLQHANALGHSGEHRRALDAARRGTQANPAMTAEHYASVVTQMAATEAVVQRRLGGLRACGLLPHYPSAK